MFFLLAKSNETETKLILYRTNECTNWIDDISVEWRSIYNEKLNIIKLNGSIVNPYCCYRTESFIEFQFAKSCEEMR